MFAASSQRHDDYHDDTFNSTLLLDNNNVSRLNGDAVSSLAKDSTFLNGASNFSWPQMDAHPAVIMASYPSPHVDASSNLSANFTANAKANSDVNENTNHSLSYDVVSHLPFSGDESITKNDRNFTNELSIGVSVSSTSLGMELSPEMVTDPSPSSLAELSPSSETNWTQQGADLSSTHEMEWNSS